jgi:two-component system, chemotaxis family, response regulator Rcp1
VLFVAYIPSDRESYLQTKQWFRLQIDMDILLVEDNPGDARLAQEVFRQSNAPVSLHIVSDGEDAMSFLRREGVHVHVPRPHLILLDLNLPKLSGRETLAQIKSDNRFKSIPTVILTTSDAEEDIML